MLLLLSLLLLLLSKQVHPTSLAVNVFEVEQVLPLQRVFGIAREMPKVLAEFRLFNIC